MEYFGNNLHESPIEEGPWNDAAGIYDGKI